MPAQAKQIWIPPILVAAATASSDQWFNHSLTGTVMLHLLAVTAAAYALSFTLSTLTAFLSFLAINYFFIEPRYTFEVASSESWAVLGGFLTVSIVVASLSYRLKMQSVLAEKARNQAETARILAERLSEAPDESTLLEIATQLLHLTTRLPTGIVLPHASGEFILQHSSSPERIQLDQRACHWCSQNARMIGPGTGNWPELGQLILPFERLPGRFPLLVIEKNSTTIEDGEITFLRGLLDQVATAYQRIRQEHRAKEAESHAQEEAIQNALLASISHDMRTPLTAIVGATSTLLTQKSHLNEMEQTRLLKSVEAEAHHLVSTTENILSLSQLELTGAQALQLDWQSLEEIVGAVLHRYRNRHIQQKLRSNVEHELPLIRGDAALLTQAIGNLIDNALKMHRGSDPILIEVTACGHDSVALSVNDRGPGFPAGFAPSSIRKFQQVHPEKNGMGLGLMIVKTIARLHHAQLEIRSREGGGSTVSIIFHCTDNIGVFDE